MRTVRTGGSREELRSVLARRPPADYVYAYPPRQAYRPVRPEDLRSATERSLAGADSVDLYLHFPFCRQICSFCNLYAVVGSDKGAFERYVDSLLVEASTYAPLIAGKAISTVYLGGGTPSQVPPQLVDSLLDGLERLYGFDRGAVVEVALEVAPDTVTSSRLADFRAAGVNRVNLGLQTADDREMCGIGRRHGAALSLAAVEAALDAGFHNVCVDLIYGLEGQSEESWETSVATLAALAPPTICAYPLTLRPATGYAARGFTETDGAVQATRYDHVEQVLGAHGYRQETHVRWALGVAGGYRQKANHWALSNVLGLGAGARGYLWECDYRNGYSARRRMPVLNEWLADVADHGHGRRDGFLMDTGERMRKALVLGLHDLDRTWFKTRFDCDPMAVFSSQLEPLAEFGLLEVGEDRLALTREGMRSRDLLVQPFFSERVLRRVENYNYGDG
jgi:oxygen-independent coproporphyrinogen III oxidase